MHSVVPDMLNVVDRQETYRAAEMSASVIMFLCNYFSTTN
jgi:hypothetical protein